MVIATIADIHFNAVKAAKLFYQLNECFLNYLRNHKVDMVVIAGDYYDSIVSLNSSTARASMEFMTQLVKVAELTGIKYIRIIKGTASHDNNQLENLRLFERNTTPSVKIFNTVTNEDIDSFHFLFIPEEYMKSVDEYYKEYFENANYDAIFGHGMFKETSFQASKQESAITLSKAPIFDSKQMSSICNGPILFGHIHTHCSIRDKIVYIGSFSRWVYGEEEEKGFLITDLKESGKYTNEFIENSLAERYDTYTRIVTNEVDPEEIISDAKALIKDYLRIQVILAANMDFSYVIEFLREYYAKKPEYKLVITDKSQVTKKIEQEKRIEDLMDKYGFVFSNTIPRIGKISKFIKVRDNEDVSEEEVKGVLRTLK